MRYGIVFSTPYEDDELIAVFDDEGWANAICKFLNKHRAIDESYELAEVDDYSDWPSIDGVAKKK